MLSLVKRQYMLSFFLDLDHHTPVKRAYLERGEMRRNGKWGRLNTERHIGDVCKNHRASVMFIVQRKHLFLLQLNIFECG